MKVMANEILSNSEQPPESVELYIRDEDGNYIPVEVEHPDDGEQVEGTFVLAQASTHIGPLPSVDQFRAYGEVVPDAPERILRMAEKEQDAYHTFMDKQLKGRFSAVTQGQWMGFIAMMVALLGAIYLAVGGHIAVALALASPSVIIPIMRFYYTGKHEGAGTATTKRDSAQEPDE